MQQAVGNESLCRVKLLSLNNKAYGTSNKTQGWEISEDSAEPGGAVPSVILTHYKMIINLFWILMNTECMD